MANTFKNVKQRDVGTANTKIGGYNVPASTTSILIGLLVSNKLNIGVTASIQLFDGTNYTYILKDAPIPVGASLQVIEGKLVILPGEALYVSCSQNAGADVVMSFMERT